jgi:hypothetical protein
LGGGPAPPRLDEDDPAGMALATAAIAEVAGTYEIPKRWVGSVYMDTMLIPLFVVRCY